eukprot:gene3575-4091_t
MTLEIAVFLFFACLLPSIAFGVLHQSNTQGHFSVSKTIVSQGVGGMIFALTSGQPMVVLLSTAPIAIFIKITYSIAQANNLDFWSLYAMIGLANALFLIIYAVSGASRLMRYSSRFIGETFALFITIAFLYDGTKPIVELFIDQVYRCPSTGCTPVEPLLTLFLAITTLWICYKFSVFQHTHLFNPVARGVISDYALFLGVLLASLIRHSIFRPLDLEVFPTGLDNILNTTFRSMPVHGYFIALAIGFLLSVLYFVDQNISSSLATAPEHNLKKWSGPHLDLLVVAFINIALSFLGLPWIHGALPHSSLHVRALATIQSTILKDHNVEVFISVQETRASGFFSHLLVFVCLFLTSSVISYIPVPVLYGVLWFLGVKALLGNQFWERMLLVITDQNLYPHTLMSRQTKPKMMVPAGLLKRKQVATPSSLAAKKAAAGVISSKPVTYSASTMSKLQESSEVKLPTYNSHIMRERPLVTMEEPKKLKFEMTAAGATWEDPTLSEWDANDFRVFVGDLGNDVTDEMLRQAFSKYPTVLKAKVLRDKKTMKTKGFGFVSFSNSTDYVKAIKEMNGNRPIKCRKSNWKDRTSAITPIKK